MLRLTRSEFFGEYFDYRKGEHLSLIYPTRRGKTHLAYECLHAAMKQNPDLSVVSLMPKPRDPATTDLVHKQDARDRVSGRRWMVGTIIAVMMLLVAMLTILIQVLQHVH